MAEARARLDPEEIALMAKLYGWHKVQHDPCLFILGFRKEGMRINVYYSKMTVSTALNHPKKGKTQLFRRNVSRSLLEKIFQYPRVHTHKGYYTK